MKRRLLKSTSKKPSLLTKEEAERFKKLSDLEIMAIQIEDEDLNEWRKKWLKL